jgi:hypothetical protein
MHRFLTTALVVFFVTACGGDDDGKGSGATGGGSGNGGSLGGAAGASGSGGLGTGGISSGGSGGGSGGGPTGPMYAELWYAVDQLLVRIELDQTDGSVTDIQSSKIALGLEVGQSAITMLNDGSLLVSRLGKSDHQSRFFHVLDPPRDGSDVTPVDLGVMPGGILVEGLYTDCEGRLYVMDSGVDDSSSQGNRLLRFTGDVTAGDFTFVVVSDLSSADVADIDDMSPGISNNQITDNPGLAIDTGDIYAFDYETGSGTQVAKAGTFGIHALGGPLFSDQKSRLYVLDSNAALFEVDPVSFAVSSVLGTGPTPAQGTPGWSSLAGPLTSCTTGFTPPT